MCNILETFVQLSRPRQGRLLLSQGTLWLSPPPKGDSSSAKGGSRRGHPPRAAPPQPREALAEAIPHQKLLMSSFPKTEAPFRGPHNNLQG
eukprot:365576-Chlamydomonas_euryale.AAC.8